MRKEGSRRSGRTTWKLGCKLNLRDYQYSRSPLYKPIRLLFLRERPAVCTSAYLRVLPIPLSLSLSLCARPDFAAADKLLSRRGLSDVATSLRAPMSGRDVAAVSFRRARSNLGINAEARPVKGHGTASEG